MRVSYTAPLEAVFFACWPKVPCSCEENTRIMCHSFYCCFAFSHMACHYCRFSLLTSFLLYSRKLGTLICRSSLWPNCAEFLILPPYKMWKMISLSVKWNAKLFTCLVGELLNSLHDDEGRDLPTNKLKSTPCSDSSSKRLAAWHSFLSIGKTYWIPGECSYSYCYCFAIGDFASAELMLAIIIFPSIPTVCLPLPV